ncbi:hypothetical protein [Paenibacillus sp. S150]|nr:hypothetical protein [Paenibacillus sp. S150]
MENVCDDVAEQLRDIGLMDRAFLKAGNAMAKMPMALPAGQKGFF